MHELEKEAYFQMFNFIEVNDVQLSGTYIIIPLHIYRKFKKEIFEEMGESELKEREEA